MRIGLIADIHSNLTALEAVLSELEDLEINKFLCTGDIVGYGARPNECIEKVRKINAIAIAGNHDWFVSHERDLSWFNPRAVKGIKYTRRKITKSNLNYLKKLKKRRKVNIDDKEILLTHGSPEEPLLEYVRKSRDESYFEKALEENQVDILMLGHTHIPFKKRLDNGLVVNSGSVGQPRDDNPKASYAVLNTGSMEAEINRVSYDIEKTAGRIKEAGLPSSIAERLFQGR